MSLSLKDTTGNGGGGGHKIAKGVYADIVPIKKITDTSGKELEFIKQSFDLSICVELDIPDVSFTPTVDIFGNFKRTGKKIVDWGGAFLVGRFFNAMGVGSDLNEDYTIPKQWLTKAKGEMVARVSYAAGTKPDDPDKIKWHTWRTLIPQGDRSEEELIEAVKDQWAIERQRGYPRDYDASAVKSKTTSEPDYEESSDAVPSAASATSGSMPDDYDDVPF